MFEKFCARPTVWQHSKLTVSAHSKPKMITKRVRRCSEKMHQMCKHQHIDPCEWCNQTVRLNDHVWEVLCPLHCLTVSKIDNFSPQRVKNSHNKSLFVVRKATPGAQTPTHGPRYMMQSSCDVKWPYLRSYVPTALSGSVQN